MTKRIFHSICIVSLAVLLAAFCIIGGVTYDYFNTQLKIELAQEAQFVARGVETGGFAYLFGFDEADTRITWVAADGSVLYDSRADAAGMENHLDRAEIASAFETGSGSAQRHSGTLSERTLYYALRLSDGTVIRVSSTQLSAWTLLLCMLQPVLFVTILALALGGVLAMRLSRRITRPIQELDVDHPETLSQYEELQPLVEKLQFQKRQLALQMRELQIKQTEFESITSAMNEGIVIIDHRADILSCNSSALRMLDDAGDARQRRNLLSVSREEALRHVVREALSGSRCEDAVRASGRYYRITGSPVANGDGVTGAVIMITDDTEKEKTETLRREFTANVSHELKTPLTSISGFAELIRDGIAQGEDAARFAGNIYKEAGRLITLVGDIIKLSQLDSGEIPYDAEDIDLYDAAREVAQRLEPVAAQAHSALELSGEHITVHGNRQILEEMLYNLCDNGIKYGREQGHVRIRVGSSQGRATISVADDGIGIPADSLDRVFERFYRVDKSRSKAIGGTGLGLSIVKHGAAYHNAKIDIESEVGKGTTLTLTF